MVNKRRTKTNNWFQQAYRDPLRYIFLNKIRKNVPLVHRSITIHNPANTVEVNNETPPPSYSRVYQRYYRSKRSMKKKPKLVKNKNSTQSSYTGNPLTPPTFSPIPKVMTSTPKRSRSVDFSLSNYSPTDKYGVGAISRGNTQSLIRSFSSKAENGAIQKAKAKPKIDINSYTYQLRRGSRTRKPNVKYSP